MSTCLFSYITGLGGRILICTLVPVLPTDIHLLTPFSWIPNLLLPHMSPCWHFYNVLKHFCKKKKKKKYTSKIAFRHFTQFFRSLPAAVFTDIYHFYLFFICSILCSLQSFRHSVKCLASNYVHHKSDVTSAQVLNQVTSNHYCSAYVAKCLI